MSRDNESLAGIELFKGVPDPTLKTLGESCRWRRYEKGQQILGHLDETLEVFFIVTGKARAVIYSASGKEVIFPDIETGETFGELAVIDGRPRAASVVALTDMLVASMGADGFWQVLRENPDVSATIMKRLSSLVRQLSERVFEMSTLAAKNRIHAELLRLSQGREERENTALISPAPTHAEIAARVSTRREAVSREMSVLRRDGLIERHGQDLAICDLSRLRHMVDELIDL